MGSWCRWLRIAGWGCVGMGAGWGWAVALMPSAVPGVAFQHR